MNRTRFLFSGMFIPNLALVAVLGMPGSVAAEPVPPVAGPMSEVRVDVRDFGAKGDGRADDTAALQKALDGGRRTVVIPPGTYLISAALRLDSDTHLHADCRAVIRLADHAGNSVGVFLLRNRDEQAGNHDIWVEGGIWDGNGANNPRGKVPPCYTGVALNFINIERFVLSGLVVRDPESFAIRAWRLRQFRIDDIGFDYSSRKGKDGVHLNGYCEHGLVRNIRTLSHFATNDDMIALNADDAPGAPPWVMCQGTVMGPIRDVRVEHIRADNTYTFVRLLSRDHPIEDVVVSDVVGGCRASAVTMHRWRFPRGCGDIRHVVLRDFQVHKMADPGHVYQEARPLIDIELATHDFRIENFRRDPVPQPASVTLLIENGLTNRMQFQRLGEAGPHTTISNQSFSLASGGFSLLALDSRAAAAPAVRH